MSEGPFGIIPRVFGLSPLAIEECELSPIEKRKYVKISNNLAEDVGEHHASLHNEKLQEVVGKVGLKLIGEGANRLVFEYQDSCVLKLSKSPRPYQNNTEAAIWNTRLSDEEKEYFAPTIDSSEDNRVITSLIAEPISDEEYFRLAKKLYLDFGMDFIDLRQDNAGVVNGNPVVVDYGTGFNRIDQTPTFDSREEAWEKFKERLKRNTT